MDIDVDIDLKLKLNFIVRVVIDELFILIYSWIIKSIEWCINILKYSYRDKVIIVK